MIALPKWLTPADGKSIDAGTKADAPLPERIEWLKRVRLFSDVLTVPGAIEHVANIMEVRHFKKGAAILREGAEGAEAFFLTHGSVRVLKSISGGEGFPVAMLEAKDHPFFGEAALLEADRRSATITTESDSTCMILHKDAFDKFCQTHPEVALPIVLRIARVVLDRLHKTNNDMILLYNALLSEVKGL